MIKIDGTYKCFKYPVGEQMIKITELCSQLIDITWDYESDEEIFKLMLIVNAIRETGQEVEYLYLSYIPHSRQDRVINWGESFSLKVLANVINSLSFKEVIIDDPHSIASYILIDRIRVRNQRFLASAFLMSLTDSHYLISPDAGATKKIRNNITEETLDVVECSKVRDLKTGDIIKTVVYYDDFKGKDCVIMDDICDGGRTFTEIAKVLKTKNAGKIKLYVTHGFFTKGLEVFNGLIDEIWTKKGRIK